jgi:hypothetical protein
MLFGELVEQRFRLVHDDAGSATCLPLREPALLEDGDINAAAASTYAVAHTQRTAADDGDFDLEVAAMPWIRRATG